MSSVSRKQREMVGQFQNVTGSSDKMAVSYLQRANWSLYHAVDVFYQEGHHVAKVAPQKSRRAVDERKIVTIFNQYASKSSGSDEAIIDSEGVERLCSDLGFSPLDPVALALCFHIGASTMGEFSRKEFIAGLKKMHVEDVAKLRKRVDQYRKDLLDKDKCRDVYCFTFGFALDQDGQRCLPLELCVEFWKLLLPPHFKLLDEWLQFCEQSKMKAVTKDTWNLLYDMATTVSEDLSDFDEDGAWPVIIDEFVDWVKERRKDGSATAA